MAETAARHAIYHMPQAGSALAAVGAGWLGWDAERGEPAAPPHVAGLPRAAHDLTATPRKYGFHATLKAPFRLAPGQDAAALCTALDAFAAATPTATLPGLKVARLGRFVALVPDGDSASVDALAAGVVRAFEPFRAPVTEAERARRDPARLTARQAAMLERWGYPFAMEEFRFHMTLTGPLDADEAAAVEAALAALLAPVIPRPYPVARLVLAAEGADGRFRVVHHAALSG